MPPVLAARTLGLPRWVWLTIVVGGGGLGLYLRLHNNDEAMEQVEEEEALNTGNVMPKAPGITAEGGGVSGGGGFETKPPNAKEQPPIVELPESSPYDSVELPESPPPPAEQAPEADRNPAPPVQAESFQQNNTITAPGTIKVSEHTNLGSGGGGQGPGSEGHPAAVDTGNPCVRGGIGGHRPPDGYHLYCGGNGNIWRAPN